MSVAYNEHDAARRLAEPAKSAVLAGSWQPKRSPFSRDRARVLHSAALRRMAGKTQVVGPGEEAVATGMPRTRLTHSLEVAQIGREIAEDLGCDPDVVDTACVAHDIGHPPFGHNGEHALHELAGPCGGFEGNAQTLRILTRLEPKVLGPDGHSYGLNLTRAVLDASTKYPWRRKPGLTKFGAYDDDREAFEWIRAGAPGEHKCLEAQVMDWADDVAYSVHDVEDGVRAGSISMSALADPSERAAVAELAAKHFSSQSVSELEEAALDLLRLPVVADLALPGYDGSLGAQVALKRMTSELVGRFAGAAVAATRHDYGDGPLRRYDADLVVPDRVAAEVALLKAAALHWVMSDPDRLAMQARQRELVADLVAVLSRQAPDALEPAFRPVWQDATDDAHRLRVIVDQVAALTDAQAVNWHSAFV
jgi:dGTPase